MKRKPSFRGSSALWPPARKSRLPTAVFRWPAWSPCLQKNRSVFWEFFAGSSASRRILTRRCPRPCSSYSKAERKSAPGRPRSANEVSARHERLSLEPCGRAQTQSEGQRPPDLFFRGVVSLRSQLLGNRHQVCPWLAASSEGAFGIHSSRAAFLGHPPPQYHPRTRLACGRAACASS